MRRDFSYLGDTGLVWAFLPRTALVNDRIQLMSGSSQLPGYLLGQRSFAASGSTDDMDTSHEAHVLGLCNVLQETEVTSLPRVQIALHELHAILQGTFDGDVLDPVVV